MTPRARRVIELANDESKMLGQDKIDVETHNARNRS